MLISTVAPEVFTPPPYLFSASDLGLFIGSAFIAIIIAYPFSGPFTDMLSRMVARMHRDKQHQPEYRLPSLILPFLVAPPGLILFAHTIAHKKSYYIAAVGSGMQATSLVTVSAVVLSVVVDGWPEGGSEALVLINAGKNLVAFGVSVGITRWIEQIGIIKLFWAIAGVQWGVLLFAIPLFFLGPWLRIKTLWLV